MVFCGSHRARERALRVLYKGYRLRVTGDRRRVMGDGGEGLAAHKYAAQRRYITGLCRDNRRTMISVEVVIPHKSPY